MVMKRIRPAGDGIKPMEDSNQSNSIIRDNKTNAPSIEGQIINRTGSTPSSSSPPFEQDGSDSASNTSTHGSMGIPDSQMDATCKAQVLRKCDASSGRNNRNGSNRRNCGGSASTLTSSKSPWPSQSSAALEEADEQDGGRCSSSGPSASGKSDPKTGASSAREAADRNDEIMQSAGAGDSGMAHGVAQRKDEIVENAGAGGSGDDVGEGDAVGGAKQLNIFVLVRLLFHYLESVDPHLLLEAKRALKDCDRRKREGDPGYQKLSEVIPRRLRRIVGDRHWGRALAIQRNYLLQKKRKKKQRDEMIQHRRIISRKKDKMGKSANPNIVSMESSIDTTAQASAASADSSAASASVSASALAEKQQSDTANKTFFPSSPPQPVASMFNPGLLQRVIVPNRDGNTTRSTSTSVAGNHDSNNISQARILSPFEVAQRALAAQVEAYNQASTQLGLEPQMQQQGQQLAFGFPPAPEAQSLQTSVAAAAWQGRMLTSSCHSDDSSECSSS
jgi:cell division septum initiation protein DivIVA